MAAQTARTRLRSVATHARIALAALVTLCAAGAARASDVLVVRTGDATPYTQASDAAMRRLRSAGVSAAAALLEDVPAASLSSSGAPRLVLAIGTEAAIAMRDRAPEGVAIVYCLVADPARAGLSDVAGIAGVSTETPPEPQIALMRAVLPETRVIGALYRSSDPATVASIASLRAALPPGWRVEAVDIDASASIAESIDRVFGRDIDFFWTSPERSIYDQATIRQLLLTSLRRRVPVFGFSEAFVRAGALVGVSIEPADQGEQAAEIAITRLRRGAEAGAQRVDAAPVHRTAKARVALNRVVAEKLGIKLPNRVVSDADTVFGDS